MSDHPLKLTSPRLDQEEFGLTPVGRRAANPSRNAASRNSTKSTRAVPEPDSEIVEQTEQADIFDAVTAADGGQDDG